jgi:hypothetical protein
MVASVSDVQKFFGQFEFKLRTAKAAQQQTDVYLAGRLNVVRDYMDPDENRISDIFSDLLDPNGPHVPHGQGEVFLKLFLETVRLRESMLEKVERPRRENPTSTGRRMDILLTFKSGRAVAIENKPDAADQPNQVNDYCDYLDHRFLGQYVFFYLTPRGDMPSDFSIEPTKRKLLISQGQLRCIAYCREVRAWLTSCIKECCAEKVRWFLRDLGDFFVEKYGSV